MGGVNWMFIGGLLAVLAVVFVLNKSQKKGK
jgi:hypothetical protein